MQALILSVLPVAKRLHEDARLRRRVEEILNAKVKTLSVLIGGAGAR